MKALSYSEYYVTARESVLRVLGDGLWHSWRDLEAAGGNRYGARLDELRSEGMTIEAEDLPDHGSDTGCSRTRALDGHRACGCTLSRATHAKSQRGA